MLYVSFWNIALSNLPGKSFAKRLVSDRDVASAISEVRAEGTLLCVSSADLNAPYEKRRYDYHVEVCHALRMRGIELTVEDFFGGSFGNPLAIARVSEEHRLLVVDCYLALNNDASVHDCEKKEALPGAKERGARHLPRLLQILPESLACYMFEEVAP